MKRWTILIYGVLSYLMFFGVFLYSVGFIGNLLVPNSLDSAPSSSVGFALTINLLLLSAFAVQHSLMARPFFKRWLTNFIPQPAERSTYVLASNIAMIAMFIWWQPLGYSVWTFTSPVLVTSLYAVFLVGWVIVFVATCLISHFDLFGLRQIWLNFQGRPYSSVAFTKPGPYKLVRHPMYVGWILVFWATPTMTAGHLFFAVATTIYILVAIRLEEHDLINALGVDYLNYQNEVPMLVPRFGATLAAESGIHPT